MALFVKTIFSALKFSVVLWLFTQIASTLANYDQMNSGINENCIEKDLSTRHVMRRALGRSVLGSKPDFFSLFSRAGHHRGQGAITFDYANLIQNDVILLDDSIETQTRKRGSVLIPPTRRNVYRPADTEMCNSCTAEVSHKTFGKEYYPRRVYHKICNVDQKCSGLYTCQPIVYNIPLLTAKLKGAVVSTDDLRLPTDLQKNWTFHLKPVTVACLCM